MKEFLCSRPFVYAVSLVISLVLNMYRPDVKDVLCTVIPVTGSGNEGDRYQPSRTSHQQQPMEMIK
jgi:hypothetical protein